MRILIFLVQIFDIIIHAATNQLELLRVISNLTIIVWVVIITVHKTKHKITQLALIFIGGYLGLNTLFLTNEGLININSGKPRSLLFLFVFITIGLSIKLCFQWIDKNTSNRSELN